MENFGVERKETLAMFVKEDMGFFFFSFLSFLKMLCTKSASAVSSCLHLSMHQPAMFFM